jgi:hypothetical protein
MMKIEKYHNVIDHLTVISEIVYLCLDGTLGELNNEQRESLKMAERNIWKLYASLGDLLHIKLKKVYKKF